MGSIACKKAIDAVESKGMLLLLSLPTFKLTLKDTLPTPVAPKIDAIKPAKTAISLLPERRSFAKNLTSLALILFSLEDIFLARFYHNFSSLSIVFIQNTQ
jgi:hypothetical protein